MEPALLLLLAVLVLVASVGAAFFVLAKKTAQAADSAQSGQEDDVANVANVRGHAPVLGRAVRTDRPPCAEASDQTRPSLHATFRSQVAGNRAARRQGARARIGAANLRHRCATPACILAARPQAVHSSSA